MSSKINQYNFLNRLKINLFTPIRQLAGRGKRRKSILNDRDAKYFTGTFGILKSYNNFAP